MNRPQGLGVAVFRNDASGMFALLARCPLPAARCPLHNSTIGLCDGQASAPDAGCTPKFAVKVGDGAVYLDARELRTGHDGHRPHVAHCGACAARPLCLKQNYKIDSCQRLMDKR